MLRELENYMKKEEVLADPQHPVLIDSYLQNAIELDVDAVCDGEEVLIGGIMEHIEQAGIHSGDSACVIPTQSLSPEIIQDGPGIYPQNRSGTRRYRAREPPACSQGQDGLCP